MERYLNVSGFLFDGLCFHGGEKMKILMLILAALAWSMICTAFEVPLWLNILVAGMLGWYWTRIYAFLFDKWDR